MSPFDAALTAAWMVENIFPEPPVSADDARTVAEPTDSATTANTGSQILLLLMTGLMNRSSGEFPFARTTCAPARQSDVARASGRPFVAPGPPTSSRRPGRDRTEIPRRTRRRRETTW